MNFDAKDTKIAEKSANIDFSSRLGPALEALRGARAVVYPTETFYAVGVDACSKPALERLFAIKQRELGKAVGLIIGDLEAALQVAREIPAPARRLAEALWPGPLTIVLPARPSLAPELVGPTGGVAVRVSSHPLARALALEFGRPLTATSANLSGQPAARTLAQARAALGVSVDAYVDGGYLDAELPSTVVAFEAGKLVILRCGAVSEASLRAAFAD
jgi:L-threonylcarbamoyladenylate synthase